MLWPPRAGLEPRSSLFPEALPPARQQFPAYAGLPTQGRKRNSLFMKPHQQLTLSNRICRLLAAHPTICDLCPGTSQPGFSPALFLFVEDADALYAECAAQGVEFTRGLGNMPWHRREFVVKDCDGRLLAFGANL